MSSAADSASARLYSNPTRSESVWSRNTIASFSPARHGEIPGLRSDAVRVAAEIRAQRGFQHAFVRRHPPEPRFLHQRHHLGRNGAFAGPEPARVAAEAVAVERDGAPQVGAGVVLHV